MAVCAGRMATCAGQDDCVCSTEWACKGRKDEYTWAKSRGEAKALGRLQKVLTSMMGLKGHEGLDPMEENIITGVPEGLCL